MKLKFIPINEKKVPIVKNWQTSTEDFTLNGYGVGLVCGKLSDGIEAVDIDLKYDLTGDLMKRYSEAVKEQAPDLLQKLVVQQTVSKGYHFIYRCETIEGNQKLAQREAIEAEKIEGEKVKVLIETRGEGGYIAVYPTKGYTIKRGSLDSIPTITIEEREILLSTARRFNELIKKVEIPHTVINKRSNGLLPGEDFNDRGDVVQLLSSHGWKMVETKGSKVYFRRPGNTSAHTSGNFDLDKRLFSVFTTSSQFEPMKGYQPFHLFAVLECNGDFSEAAKRLYDLGYGDRHEAPPKVEATPSRISKDDDDLSFIAERPDIDRYLELAREGKFEKGKTTGFPDLDKHFLIKKNLLIINGHDNVGKSVFIWYLRFLASLLHGENTIIFTGENSEGYVYRKLVEFYYSRQIESLTPQEISHAMDFVYEKIKLIKNGDKLYNYADILNIVDKYNNWWRADCAVIEPYNALDVVLTGGLSEHAFHYKAISEMKLYQTNNKMGFVINAHAITESLRRLDAEGNPQAPGKADTEGGGKFSNKADDFLTLHRLTQHPDRWMELQIHVRKIKETESGGYPTGKDKPIILRSVKGVVGYTEGDAYNLINPVTRFHEKTKPYETVIVPNTEFDKQVDYENDLPF